MKITVELKREKVYLIPYRWGGHILDPASICGEPNKTKFFQMKGEIQNIVTLSSENNGPASIIRQESESQKQNK